MKMAIKQMSPKSKTGREKINETTWQGDGNPSLMTWNWRKQPKAVSAPSSNRMKHKWLSKNAGPSAEKEGPAEIWSECFMIYRFTYAVFRALSSARWVLQRKYIRHLFESKVEGKVTRISNLKMETTHDPYHCWETCRNQHIYNCKF